MYFYNIWRKKRRVERVRGSEKEEESRLEGGRVHISFLHHNLS